MVRRTALAQRNPLQVHLLLWLCLGLMTLLLSWAEWVNPFYKAEHPRSSTETKLMKGEAFWYLLGAMVMQGGERLPQSQTGRLLVSCWCLFGVVMGAAYSGNLVAFLTVTKDWLPFDSMAGMLEQSQYVFGLHGGTYYRNLIETGKTDTYRALWQRIQSFQEQGLDVLNVDPNVHKERVVRGQYAFISDKNGMDSWLELDCDLRVLDNELMSLNYAIGLPNNSPQLDLFSNQMLRMHEGGLVQVMRRRWWTDEKFCRGSLVSAAEGITLVDVQSAFYLLFVGLTAAALALLAEVALREWCRRRPRRDPRRRSEVVASVESNTRLTREIRGGLEKDQIDKSARVFSVRHFPHDNENLRQIPFHQQFGKAVVDDPVTLPSHGVTFFEHNDIFIY